MPISKQYTLGLSVLEMLMVIAIVASLMAVAVSRMRERDQDSIFRKDVTGFVSQVGRALSMVESRNSATCGRDETLRNISIVRQGTNGYALLPFCSLRVTPDVTVTPVPQSAYLLMGSTWDTGSDMVFAVFDVDGSVSAGVNGMIFRRGGLSCTARISSSGVVSLVGGDCPPQ